MHFWNAVVVLFAIACWTWLRSQKYRTPGDRLLGGGEPAARDPELERQVEEMKKRIAVLERIATDEKRGHDLAREIESLRD